MPQNKEEEGISFPSWRGAEFLGCRHGSATLQLQVSRNLFRWTKEAKYADHYERLLINGIMGNQRGTELGVMIYFLPMGPCRSNDTFWCCYGTGIESFSKLGDTIYFLGDDEMPAVYIVQYIPSTFDWKAAGLTVKQQAKPLLSTDPYFEVAISVSSNDGDAQAAKVSVRIPSWTSMGSATVTLNGQKLNLTSAVDFLTLTKLWGDDELVFQFPIHLRTEAIKDDRPEYAPIQAVLFGPHLLAGCFSLFFMAAELFFLLAGSNGIKSEEHLTTRELMCTT